MSLVRSMLYYCFCRPNHSYGSVAMCTFSVFESYNVSYIISIDVIEDRLGRDETTAQNGTRLKNQNSKICQGTTKMYSRLVDGP